MIKGKLFYVIGPSGSGKDSLMRYARERLAGDAGILFAHRYITRAAELAGENHIALTAPEFDARRSAGLFAMDWGSHELRYGIGLEINFWLENGCNVVMNGSREYLAQARCLYPALVAVLVVVAPGVLAERLRLRGRETEHQIAQRLERSSEFMHPDGQMEIIHNDSALHEAGERLVQILSGGELPLQALA